MKRTLLIAITVIALGVTGTATVGTLHAQDKAAAKPPATMPMDRDMQPMMEHMKKMQADMQRIQQTSDPAERQKLMQEHMKQMHEGMGMMRGMGGGMMGGSAKGPPRPMGPDQRMNMMEQRMEMMQTMMEQMMHHQRMSSPPAGK